MALLPFDIAKGAGYDSARFSGGALERVETIIVGAGLAGMSTALHLGSDEHLVLEGAPRAGGLCVTRFEKGYGFDVTGHWLHLRDPDIRQRFGNLVPMEQVVRKSRILAHGRLIAYPFQSNLKDLPEAVKQACLEGAREAHLRRESGAAEPGRFGDYVLHHFGEGIAREFMFPYNQKLWGVPPNEISHAWCQRFVPVPDYRQILDGASSDRNERTGYNATFSYPVAGGIGAFTAALEEKVAPAIRYGSRVVAVHPSERWVECQDGRRYGYHRLVSTAPLKDLVGMLIGAPPEVSQAGSRLRAASVTYYDLGVRGRVLAGQHWIYLPAPGLPAYRLGCYSNAMPYMAPEGCSSLYVELSNGVEIDHEEALSSVLEVLDSLGTTVGREDVEVWRIREIPYAYVLYDEAYESARTSVMQWLGGMGISSIGRYGSWVYNSMEDALVEGRDTALALRTQPA
jgi:protoporphyrinogen oxidase